MSNGDLQLCQRKLSALAWSDSFIRITILEVRCQTERKLRASGEIFIL